MTEAKRRANVGASVLQHPALVSVLQQVHLADASGQLRQCNIADQGLGPGPIVDMSVIEKLGELDTTRDLSHLAWMLEQAGGGEEARAKSMEKYEMCKALFIGERMAGRGEGGKVKIDPMSNEQAEAAWAAEEQTFRNAFIPADQDLMLQTNGEVFGFNRLWPGFDQRFEQIYLQVKAFRDNMVGREGPQSKVSLINQARASRAREEGEEYTPVNVELTAYSGIEALEKVNDEFKYFFKRRTASKDIQFIGRGPENVYLRGGDVKFYEDDNLVAYVPATAAAMMKVGFDNWCVANKSEFERAFTAARKERPMPWAEYTGAGPLMVMVAKKDMAEPAYPEGHQYYQSMRKIAVHIRRELCDIPNLQAPYEGVQFFDRINRYHPRPVDWYELVGRLSETPHGGEMTESIHRAMNAFIAWTRQMKPDDIKSSVYERLAAVLVYELLYS